MTAANVVTRLLSGKDSFCCLCFASVGEDALGLQDEVFVDFKTSKTVEIDNILNYLFGNKYPKVASHDVICTSCLKSARASYNFIKMCKDNSDQLINVVNTLNDCFENTSEDLKEFKTLFIHIRTEDVESKQYYDNQRSVTNKTMALTRFRSLVYEKYVKQNKKDTGLRERRTRIHNYSEEMSKICEVFRDSNRSKFKCKVCNGIFSKSFNFKKHYYSQHSAKHLECSECGRCYGSEALLKQHKYDSHASIMCSVCGKTYKNRYSLLYHMRQHSGEHPYECRYCDMKFQWSSRRAEHIRRYHLEPSVECDICHVMFRSLGSLYDHRKRHFNPNSRLHVMQQTPPVVEEEIINSSLCDVVG